jgi:hypothetical protein
VAVHWSWPALVLEAEQRERLERWTDRSFAAANEALPALGVDLEGDGATGMLGDHGLGAALIELGDDGVAVEGLVGDQGVELDALDEGRDADRIEPVTWQEDEAHQVSQRVGERQDLGGPAALGLAYGLALSPPFAP